MQVAPLISIIIPVYNCQDDVSFAIESVLHQNLSEEEVEIILINDGSTDHTKTIIERYAARYSYIRVFHQSNIGIGKTRNRGIQYARGTYIYFLDADDFLTPNALKPILEKMQEEDLDVVGFQCKKTRSKEAAVLTNLQETLASSKIMSGTQYIETYDFMHTVWWYICNRNFLVRSGLKIAEGNEFEDSVFTTHLLYLTKKMIFIPLHIYNYYERASSIMNNSDTTHRNNIVYMYLNTILGHDSLINGIENDQIMTSSVFKTLRARQQWLAFFGISRALQSTMPIKEINHILNTMAQAKAYPLDHFIGTHYNGLKLQVFTFVFNRKYILYPMVYLYRKISRAA